MSPKQAQAKQEKVLWEVTPLTQSAAEFLKVPKHEPVYVWASGPTEALRKAARNPRVWFRRDPAWVELETIYAQVLLPSRFGGDHVFGRVRIRRAE